MAGQPNGASPVAGDRMATAPVAVQPNANHLIAMAAGNVAGRRKMAAPVLTGRARMELAAVLCLLVCRDAR